MRQLVRYSLVTIDTGLAGFGPRGMFLPADFLLFGVVHGCIVMATAAFTGVGFLHGLPDPARQYQPSTNNKGQA